LKIPDFCQAIFSTVSPSREQWSRPSDEIAHATGLLLKKNSAFIFSSDKNDFKEYFYENMFV